MVFESSLGIARESLDGRTHYMNEDLEKKYYWKRENVQIHRKGYERNKKCSFLKIVAVLRKARKAEYVIRRALF